MKNLKSKLSLRGKACFDVVISYKKSGAMFGLDARIALAIFGALSVISGAALFSAIQAAQTERYWQEFQELAKASEAYYLDNGKQLPQYNSSSLYAPDLFENRENLNTWQGPYILGERLPDIGIKNTTTRSFSDDSFFAIRLQKKSTWVGSLDSCRVDSTDCVEWVALICEADDAPEKARKLFAKLDKKIDNSDGIKAGKVRMYEDSGDVFIFIQGMPHKKLS